MDDQRSEHKPMTRNAWLDDTGLVTLPSGPRVRGRRQSDTAVDATANRSQEAG